MPRLQQCLPLAVLKLVRWCAQAAGFLGCNSAYRLRYWNNVIENVLSFASCCNSAYRLRYWNFFWLFRLSEGITVGCNSAYRLRYWNPRLAERLSQSAWSCNSAYRLRYWNDLLTYFPTFMSVVATVLTACGIETIRLAWTSALSRGVATVLTACGIETRTQPFFV